MQALEGLETVNKESMAGSEYYKRILPQVRGRVLALMPCPLIGGAFATKMTLAGALAACKAKKEAEYAKCSVCDGTLPPSLEIIPEEEFGVLKAAIKPTAPALPHTKEIWAYMNMRRRA